MCPRHEDNLHCMCLNGYGKVVKNEIIKTNKISENIEMKEFVVMSNHVHLIIKIVDNQIGHMQCAPTKGINKINCIIKIEIYSLLKYTG